MKKKAVAVSLVAALLGILSAALGFTVEANRVKKKDWVSCNSLSGIFALAAAGLLLAAQIIIHAFAGCVCCSSDRGQSTFKSIASVVASFAWISYVIATLLLIRVAWDYGFGIPKYAGRYAYCYDAAPALAASGAVLALVSVVLGIVYYHMAERLMKGAEIQAGQSRSEIPLAQPPAFVHEDTYNRRQTP